eukprot:SAG31_NODE_293_length_18292_cov_8.779586_13_plen_195_part_00
MDPQSTPQPMRPERGPSGARIGAASYRPGLVDESAPWAEQLDIHEAYQPALQPNPQDDVDFYIQAYEHLCSGQVARRLREDFCGTMLVSLAWVKSAPDRLASCVDLDSEVIAWAQQKSLNLEPQSVRERITVLCGDVLETPTPSNEADRFDVICANNYSHQCLKSRELMLKYLISCRGSLAAGGIFVLDLCGVC